MTSSLTSMRAAFLGQAVDDLKHRGVDLADRLVAAVRQRLLRLLRPLARVVDALLELLDLEGEGVLGEDRLLALQILLRRRQILILLRQALLVGRDLLLHLRLDRLAGLGFLQHPLHVDDQDDDRLHHRLVGGMRRKASHCSPCGEHHG